MVPGESDLAIWAVGLGSKDDMTKLASRGNKDGIIGGKTMSDKSDVVQAVRSCRSVPTMYYETSLQKQRRKRIQNIPIVRK